MNIDDLASIPLTSVKLINYMLRRRKINIYLVDTRGPEYITGTVHRIYKQHNEVVVDLFPFVALQFSRREHKIIRSKKHMRKVEEYDVYPELQVDINPKDEYHLMQPGYKAHARECKDFSGGFNSRDLRKLSTYLKLSGQFS